MLIWLGLGYAAFVSPIVLGMLVISWARTRRLRR
jgi:hypothetical protein